MKKSNDTKNLSENHILSLIKKDNMLMEINRTLMNDAIEKSKQDKLLNDYIYFVGENDLEYDSNLDKLLLYSNM